MTKLKVMTILGTRPEIIRLSRVMARLDDYCTHVVVHTGQNYDYELNEVFFEDLGLRTQRDLELAVVTLLDLADDGPTPGDLAESKIVTLSAAIRVESSGGTGRPPAGQHVMS